MENESYQFVELLYEDRKKVFSHDSIGSSAESEPIDISDKVVGDSFI